MRRAKRRGLARNVAVVLGNMGTRDGGPLLEAALQHDDPLASEHAAWAIEQRAAHGPGPRTVVGSETTKHRTAKSAHPPLPYV